MTETRNVIEPPSEDRPSTCKARIAKVIEAEE
jgi:hypothetical protein